MPRPIPTIVVHFTRIEHVGNIVANGLLSDTLARHHRALQVEIGDPGIKAARRARTVDRPPGGVVADYAPFYFAPRSPMMYSIEKGNVAAYQEGCDRIVYLVTTLERLRQLGLTWLATDRNARLAYARFATADELLDDHVDWPLMRQRMWNDTLDEPDRKERRMAECLVHQRVPWLAFTEIVAKNEDVAAESRGILRAAGTALPVNVRGGWYF